MPRQLEIQDLTPFRSYLLTSVTTGSVPKAVGTILDDVVSILADLKGVDPRHVSPVSRDAGLHVGFIHYTVTSKPAWVTDREEILDSRNELFLAIGFKKHVAIYTSESRLQSMVRRRVQAPDEELFDVIRLVPSVALAAALVADKEAQTLWLSGTHRRTASKADNKVLSGIDLRYALDPLGDQSFFFTAARSRNNLGTAKLETTGVAPRKSSVWISPARSWAEHRDTAKALIEIIADGRADATAPLPVLAAPANEGVTLGQLGKAYDAAFIPPEMLDGTGRDQDRELIEELSRYIIDVAVDEGDLRFTFSGSGLGEKTLEVRATPDLSDPARISFSADFDPPDDEQLLSRIDAIAHALRRHPAWLKIWFDSGFVLADRSLFQNRHRDVPFRSWTWADFSGFDITKEKPTPLQAENIGRDDSLFCWVTKQAQYRRGWLASNDGSMEIADFIHLDPATTPTTLSLIHVKGANSGADGRRVSVSAYEIVIGQAVKNLRHVDHEILGGGFIQSLDKRLKNAVWKDGNFKGGNGRSPMKKAIKSLGPNFDRRVVVIQPHVRKKPLGDARRSPSPKSRLPAQQLDTLLLGARGACQAVGAELEVVGAES